MIEMHRVFFLNRLNKVSEVPMLGDIVLLEPSLQWKLWPRRIWLLLWIPEDRSMTEESVAYPMDVPRRIMEGWKPQLINELPDAFCGGWVGYFSYDTMCYVEHKKCHFQLLAWMTETSQTSILAFMTML